MPSAWGEIDHIMIFCDAGAPEADALTDARPARGPAQFTSGAGHGEPALLLSQRVSRTVWVENFVEAQSPEARPTQLFDRWQKRARRRCPFGLVFRPGKSPPAREIPTRGPTRPGYFPKGFSIEVARDIPANEPLLFYLPFARPALVEDVETSVRCGAHRRHRGCDAAPAAYQRVCRRRSMRWSPRVSVKVEPAREYLLDLKHVGGLEEPIDLRPQLMPVRFVPLDRGCGAAALVNGNGRPLRPPVSLTTLDTALLARLFLRDPGVDRTSRWSSRRTCRSADGYPSTHGMSPL